MADGEAVDDIEPTERDESGEGPKSKSRRQRSQPHPHARVSAVFDVA